MNQTEALVLIPFLNAQRAKLEQTAPDWHFTYASRDTVTSGQMQRAAVIIGNPKASMLPACSALAWLQIGSAGTDEYCSILSPSIQFTNVTGAFGHAISEHMLACWLILCKKLHLYRDNQQYGLWKDCGQVRSIAGSTVLVIGMGDIGGQFAQKAKALGCRVIGVRRTPSEKPPFVDEIYTADAIDSLLSQADVVALSLPNTPATNGLFHEKRLALLKPGAILINVGRGNAIDTNALYAALKEGKIGGAALDVTDPEPLPADHPLWRQPNVLITPHISGAFHLEQTRENMLFICCENIRRYRAGEPLLNQIDFATGYRKK